jgi:cytoskeletal protein RodZ
MPDSFGGRLRQQRERQQIALTTIAEQTKIKLSLLEALERDDVSHWPTGIFRRAFIRSYAHAVGLPPPTRLRYLVGRAIGSLSSHTAVT